MKILFDFFPYQALHTHPEIKRFTMALGIEMAKNRNGHEMVVMADRLYPESFEVIRRAFSSILPVASFFSYCHPDAEENPYAAELLINQAYFSIHPDVVLHPDVFSGWKERGCVPVHPGNLQNLIMVGLFHPLFLEYSLKDHNDQSAVFQKWFMRKQEVLRNYDLLLSSSEASQLEKKEPLGIHTDNIFNIDFSADEKVITNQAQTSNLFQNTWDKAAKQVWELVEGKEQKRTYTWYSHQGKGQEDSQKKRLSIAIVYSTAVKRDEFFFDKLIPLLTEQYDFDFFVEPKPVFRIKNQKADQYSWNDFPKVAGQYQVVLYYVTDSPDCLPIFNLLCEYPGIVILGDISLGNMFLGGNPDLPIEKIEGLFESNHGLGAVVDQKIPGIPQTLSRWPLNRVVAQHALELIVMTLEQKNLLKKNFIWGWNPKTVALYPGAPALEIAAGILTKSFQRAVEWDERRLISDALVNMVDHLLDRQHLESYARDAALNYCLRNQSRLLINVSYIAQVDERSGIQRVVKNLVKNFVINHGVEIKFESVRIADGCLIRANSFSERLFDLPHGSLGKDQKIAIQPGDLLFLADSSWAFMDQFIPHCNEVHRQGGKVASMVFDLLPLLFPEYWSGAEGYYQVFRHWFEVSLRVSDVLVCISRSVADEVADYITNNRIQLDHSLDLAYIHLGADIQVVRAESAVRDSVKKQFENQGAPMFLMVGTLEPRKGHQFVLDTFEQLWQMGENVRLCFAGKEGWNVGSLMKRIRNHPELNSRLLFIENPKDHEINLCYKAATAAIMASCAEGFGLPIVEAALHQTPVIASDIPVFREVGGDGVVYFSLDSINSLARKVFEVTRWTAEQRKTAAQKVKTISWQESADWALDVLLNNRIYKTIS